MNTSALYNLYTEDYSADSIRKSPVTIQELIREGVPQETANLFLALSEKLYTSFLNDVLHGTKETEATLAIWCELLELCVEHNISECDCTEEFPLFNFDVVHNHRGRSFPRDLSSFRMTLEQALSYENLEERRVEREYNIIFTTDPDDAERMCVVRFNPNTHQLEKLSDAELNGILARVQAQRQKNSTIMAPNVVAKQISSAFGDVAKITEILECNYRLGDEQLALEAFADRLQEILNQPPVHNLSRKDLLWVIMGKDSCTDNKHHITDIRANFEFYNGTSKRFTIRRCAHCKQYQIDFEQLECIWKECGLPKIELMYIGADGDIDGSHWGDLSVFKEHGYTVSQEVALTANQRQQKLKRIIDQGIRSKQETICFLRRRIRFNGMKPENWLARSKWEEDLQYVQSL